LKYNYVKNIYQGKEVYKNNNLDKKIFEEIIICKKNIHFCIFKAQQMRLKKKKKTLKEAPKGVCDLSAI